MRRRVLALCAIAAVVLTTGCGTSATTLSNRMGDCTFQPGAVCRNQNLGALNLPAIDLTGADFTNSDFSRSNLRNAILRNAKLMNTNLGAADLSGADLRGADLSGAKLFTTKLDHADWVGANRSGTRYCHAILPDGSVSACQVFDSVVGSAPVPPSIETFGLHRPVRCLNDGLGEGVEVDWKVVNATSVVFLVDNVPASEAMDAAGIKRLPVPCDRKPHTLTIQAYGSAPPLATRSLTASLEPGKELPAL